MKAVVALLLVALYVMVAVCAPTRPNPAEVFEAFVNANITLRSGATEYYQGFVRADQPEGKSVIYLTNYVTDASEYHLSRFDIGKSYTILNSTDCIPSSISGHMPAYWDFVHGARYEGTIRYHGMTLDKWVNGGQSIAVTHANPNIPILVTAHTGLGEASYLFVGWNEEKPHTEWFDVPQQCHK
eukprot:TRINITY_DN14669_c0_g1_i1.p1 TRINITY_DN14669_c0_g1~~TRINITY_DN14669_c0_g1_i1.p1  ORF type:complete len:184 (-),score=34.74 TRINITY_DN14669_c0_g1_i1:37-588(-)